MRFGEGGLSQATSSPNARSRLTFSLSQMGCNGPWIKSSPDALPLPTLARVPRAWAFDLGER